MVRADIPAADLAEAFLVAGQGLNNPRALRPAATAVAPSVWRAATTVGTAVAA